MGEEFNFDNILSEEELEKLFDEEDTEKVIEDNSDKENKNDTVEKVSIENTGLSESVDSEDNDIIKSGEDTASDKSVETSPKNNFFSSIATALKEEGIFPDLDSKVAEKIVSSEDLAEVIESQIQSRFDERYKRVEDALNAGVEVSDINRYENMIGYLDSLKEADITDEGDKGETLRKQLIYQDYINRGYSNERAQREVKKSLDSGSDIEDAKEALESNKEFFKTSYNDIVESARKEEEAINRERKEQAAKLKKSIMEDKNAFGEITMDKQARQKVYDNLSKPVYKDPDTGELYTAIQKYRHDNPVDFLKNLGLVYTLTDGFKNLDGLVKEKVTKEVKKGFKDLERTINNTSRTSDGSLKFLSGINDDPNSLSSKGWRIDV